MAFVNIGSELIRKKWVMEGLVQAQSKSFFSPFTGGDRNSIVVQANSDSATEGHTVVFDYDGNLATKAIAGANTAYGNGEEKKKFSDKMTVNRYRFPVKNGDKFYGAEIENLKLTQHGDSRAKLADMFYRHKDQMLFDCAQGVKHATPTHIIDLTATFDYTALLNIETIIKTGIGFSTGSQRAPLKPYMLVDGQPVWLMLVDSYMSRAIKTSSNYQTLVYNADVRGNDNRAIKGVFGKIGNLLLVEASNFFGSTDTATLPLTADKTSTEIAGLRRYNSDSSLWSGQPGYVVASTKNRSRGVVLGANALQIGFGKMPDYLFQVDQDFGKTSESALETWMETQKTKLVAETEDYEAAKVAGIDYGVIAVDVTLD
jgi:hypothetical protein